MRILKQITLTLVLIIVANSIHSQCNWVSSSAYGTAVAPTGTTPATASPTCFYFSEHATFTGLSASSTYSVSISSGAFAGLGIYTSTTVGTAPIAWVTSGSVTVPAGTSGTIYVKTFSDISCATPATTCHTAQISCTSCVPPPPLDCNSATTLSCATPVTSGSFSSISTMSISACGFSTPGQEKLYTFTPTSSGNHTLNITNVNGGTDFVDYFYKVANGDCAVNTGWTCIDDNSATGTDVFGPLTSGTTYYILLDPEDAVSDANHTFQIDCPSACPTPTALSTSSITTSSASLNWTENGSATTWDIEWGPTGFTQGSGTLVSGTSTKPYPLSGLSPSTTYQFYVRATCGGAWSSVSSFTTQALPPSNDDCGNPININGGGTPGAPTGTPISATTVGATQSYPAIACAGFTGTANDDVFFEFITDADGGDLTITVVGSSTFDAVVSLTQTCGGASLACADATVSGGTETLTFTGAAANTGYRVRVYDYATNFSNKSNDDRAAGTFTIAAAGTALPVTLTKFSAKYMDKSNMIEWITANERNTQWHVVERSKDGISNWEKVGHVEAQGTTSQETSYQMEDKTPFALTYYRLRSIDFDGHEDRSSIVQVTRKSGVFGVTSVYPSPTTDALNVQFESTEESSVTIQIFDLNGRLVLEQQHGAVKGINMKSLSLASLASGTYSLHILTDSIISSQVKVVKQ